jgi:formate dehydrogenase (coenzyme F420) beta subunit
MDNYWALDTHGDPLGKLHDFIAFVWEAFSLDGMLVTMNNGLDARATPRLITDMESIKQVNPFMPLMELNSARLIPGLLAEHSTGRIGALLRPCELRALVEMTKHAPIDLEHLVTISVDCLGTLPVDEYRWRSERIEKNLPTSEMPDELALEVLNFARQGGIIPYRYRSACQVCPSPGADNADINFHVLGLPVRQKILVSISDSKQPAIPQLDGYANGYADQTLILQHERILSRMSERHARLMERLSQGLGNLLPTDVDALIRQLESCGDCQCCMDACPICSVDRPIRDSDGHYDRQSIEHWLVSCAGCGMCEQYCPKGLPTAAIFAYIRQQLDRQWDYIPGRMLDEPLPKM